MNSLPDALISDRGLCLSGKPIHFLKDQKKTCLRKISSLQRECLNYPHLSVEHYLDRIFVWKRLPNSTLEGALGQNSDGVRCVKDGSCLTPRNSNKVPSPSWHSSGTCRGALSHLKIQIHYNSSEGLSMVEVFAETRDLTSQDKFLRQTFQIDFIPQKGDPNETGHPSDNLSKWSGNPGYVFEKPVILAAMPTTNETKWNVTTLKIPWSRDGNCRLSSVELVEVGFGVNEMTGCHLNLTSQSHDCHEIQGQILEIWSTSTNMTHASLFGNPNVSIPTDWTKILTGNNSFTHSPSLQKSDATNCSLLTAISYRIYYSQSGPSHEPQNKVVAILRSFNHSQIDVERPKLVQVLSSVSFHDVSQPSRVSFAPPPAFKVQLPPDFFYPFFVNSGSPSVHFPIATCICGHILFFLKAKRSLY